MDRYSPCCLLPRAVRCIFLPCSKRPGIGFFSFSFSLAAIFSPFLNSEASSTLCRKRILCSLIVSPFFSSPAEGGIVVFDALLLVQTGRENIHQLLGGDLHSLCWLHPLFLSDSHSSIFFSYFIRPFDSFQLGSHQHRSLVGGKMFRPFGVGASLTPTTPTDCVFLSHRFFSASSGRDLAVFFFIFRTSQLLNTTSAIYHKMIEELRKWRLKN